MKSRPSVQLRYESTLCRKGELYLSPCSLMAAVAGIHQCGCGLPSAEVMLPICLNKAGGCSHIIYYPSASGAPCVRTSVSRLERGRRNLCMRPRILPKPSALPFRQTNVTDYEDRCHDHRYQRRPLDEEADDDGDKSQILRMTQVTIQPRRNQLSFPPMYSTPS